jgi:hypothetical protein
MANSYTQLTLTTSASATNGTGQTQYGPFDFDYLNKDDIKFAVLDPTYSAGTWTVVTVASVDETTKLVTLSATLASQFVGLTLTKARAYRATSTNALVDFQSGSRISEADLDTAYKQGLFAAQEVAEDASGSSNRAITTSSDIQDAAVIASKLATDSVEGTKIKAGVVTAAKLSDPLDLSGKTVTLSDSATNNAVSQVAVTRHLPAIKSGLDISSGMVGVLPTASGGTGRTLGGSGQVLEKFLIPCDGLSHTTQSGSFTPAAVTASVGLVATYATVGGSSINYTPPLGTKIIVYKFVTSIFATSTGIAHLKVVLGGVDVTDSKQSIELHNDAGRRTVEWSFVIGGTANPATGRHDAFSDWSGGLVIEVKARSFFTNSNDASLHGTTTFDGASSNVFSRPLIGITALS